MSYELRAKRLLRGLAAGLFSLGLATGAYGGGWEGTSSFSLTETYDDNPSRGSNSFAREQQEDGITAVRSGLTLHRATERSQLDLNHQVFHEFFYKDHGMNNTDQTGSFGYLYQFSSRLRGGMKDDLRITEDVDTNLDPRGLRFSSSRGRSRKRFNALDLFLEPQMTPRLGARLDYLHALTDVSVADESDETRQTLGATLNYLADIPRADLAYLAYNLNFSSSDRNGQDLPFRQDLPSQKGQGSPKGQGSLKAQKQISRKSQGKPKTQGQGTQADNWGEDFRSHSLQLGYTRHLDPTLTLDLRGGLNWIASNNRGDDGKQGWIGGMSLEKAWAGTKLSLKLYRDVSAGGGRGRPTTSQGLSGSLSRDFPEAPGLPERHIWRQPIRWGHPWGELEGRRGQHLRLPGPGLQLPPLRPVVGHGLLPLFCPPSERQQGERPAGGRPEERHRCGAGHRPPLRPEQQLEDGPGLRLLQEEQPTELRRPRGEQPAGLQL